MRKSNAVRKEEVIAAREQGLAHFQRRAAQSLRPLGLTFAPTVPAGCRNNCIFCFKNLFSARDAASCEVVS